MKLVFLPARRTYPADCCSIFHQTCVCSNKGSIKQKKSCCCHPDCCLVDSQTLKVAAAADKRQSWKTSFSLLKNPLVRINCFSQTPVVSVRLIHSLHSTNVTLQKVLLDFHFIIMVMRPTCRPRLADLLPSQQHTHTDRRTCCCLVVVASVARVVFSQLYATKLLQLLQRLFTLAPVRNGSLSTVLCRMQPDVPRVFLSLSFPASLGRNCSQRPACCYLSLPRLLLCRGIKTWIAQPWSCVGNKHCEVQFNCKVAQQKFWTSA